MRYDFLVLGASGMQGKIVVRDLLEKGYKVLLADLYKNGSGKIVEKYPSRAGFRFVDLRRYRATLNLIRNSGANIVVNCAESDWNLKVYQACLTAKVHVIDLDSDIATTQKQLALGPAFEKRGLTAVTGCGSTPGINNVMLSYIQKEFDQIETVNAGFAWNSNIKKFVVPFSIQSIMWEFSQPATVVEGGKLVDKPALSRMIESDFREIGRLKSFLVEHPEPFTFFHYFKNRGLKNVYFYGGFPDHSVEKIMTLIELGLHKWEKVVVDGGPKIAPPDLVTEVLKRITPPPGYTEKENLWVEVLGEKDGRPKKTLMECIVPTLPGWEDAGCNIDTGFPASIIAQMIKDGQISARGSFAPEGVVPEEEFFRKLWAKGMVVYQDGLPINGVVAETPTASRRRKAPRPVGAFV